MSKIKLEGHASGSGVLTIAAPNTDTDRTITIPDVTGTLLDSGSDLPAANLTGTIADARFPATLPAISGANLTGVGVDGISSSANATAITIDSSEQVGIGVTSPQELLHIKDGSIAVGNGTASNNAQVGRIGFSTDSANSRFIGMECYRGSDAANGDLRFHTYGGDSDAGERLRITNDGNVGIGTTSPSQKLQVAGNILLETSGNPSITNKTTGSGNNPTFRLQADTHYWDFQGTFSNANDELMFMYDGSPKLTIDSSGNVGIGTTSPDTSTYFGKVLHLAADSNVGIMFNRTSSTAAKWSVGCNSGGSLVSAKEGVAQLEITSDGRGLSQFTAKAWIQFNASNTIQDSHNVSSITDNGTGRTDINWTNAMANNDYSCQTNSSVADIWLKVNSLATTEANLRSVNAEGSYQACTYNFVTVFGD